MLIMGEAKIFLRSFKDTNLICFSFAGIQFLRDCPREPHIPVYMVVGGSVGSIKMAWVLYNQLHTRRLEIGAPNATSYGAKATSFALTLFLISWFALGNYWILKIKWPDYTPTLFEPNKWCHRTLYVFSIVHLYIIYTVMGCVVVLVITLAGFQLFGCPWLGPARYK